MRTTVTLDPDTEQVIRTRMRERNMTFKEAVNDAIRSAASAKRTGSPFVTQAVALGRSVVSLDRALQLAGEIEDDELLRRMQGAS